MYDDILIPTDGSKGARRGIESGLDLAKQYDATVHTLYVIDERIHGVRTGLSSEELLLEKLEQEGEKATGEVVELAEEQGLDARWKVVRGLPYEEIVDYARENDVDLVVMGIHGWSDRQRPHIGSVTERVIRMSETPVLPV